MTLGLIAKIFTIVIIIQFFFLCFITFLLLRRLITHRRRKINILFYLSHLMVFSALLLSRLIWFTNLFLEVEGKIRLLQEIGLLAGLGIFVILLFIVQRLELRIKNI